MNGSTARSEAIAVCRDLAQTLKVEHIETGLAEEKSLSFYRQGEFIDLCRGPHIPGAGAIGEFKLLSVAGAYWKGDSSRQQLQRVYATAWFSKEELENYLKMVEEAKRRDHRVLGKQLELFTTTPDVGAGLILWLPKGAIIRGLLESFIRDELFRRGYEPVYTPNIGRVKLYQTSGHFPYYADSQFKPINQNGPVELIELWKQLFWKRGLWPSETLSSKRLSKPGGRMASEMSLTMPTFRKRLRKRTAAIGFWLEHRASVMCSKPMNCPHHIQVYKSKPGSYRDLPVRLAEFGTVYRYEKTGELGGLTRVRGFTQDNAHLFCTENQVADEFRGCMEMTQFFLKTLGLNDSRVRLGFSRSQQHEVRRRCRGLGSSRARTGQKFAKAWALMPRPNAARRRLWPEGGLRGHGLHRPRVATRNGATRLQPAECRAFCLGISGRAICLIGR